MEGRDLGRQAVTLRDLGLIPYQEAWNLQETLLKANVDRKLAAGKSMPPGEVPTQHHLLCCQHPHVYTLGKSGKPEHVLISPEAREAQGISYFKINRGGDITYHGPGQWVVYPILDLEKFRTDIGWYLRTLEEVVIRVIAAFGLSGARIAGATGVWVDADTPHPRKICAIGVRCSRWVSMHGLALNVNTDLSYFSHIVPCGIADKGVTSLAQELGRPVSMDAVHELLIAQFEDLFEAELLR